MEESLSNSNNSINASSENVLHALDNKRMEPATSYKAGIWYQKAEQIVNLSKACNDYIETLKKESVLSADESAMLFNKIKKYESDILNVDNSIKETFINYTYLTRPADSLTISEKGFYNKFFKNTSNVSAKAFLTKLQNNVKRMENRILTFCYEQAPNSSLICTFYFPLIAQNSSVVKRGEAVEITAGIGYLERFPNSKIVINGLLIPMSEYNTAQYKLKAPNKPGKYFIPIKISYTDQDGRDQIIEKNVEYTVAKECDQ